MSRYLVFAVVGMAMLAESMSGSAVAVAFPEISSSFHSSIVLTAWVLSVFPLATIITVPLSGKASDALGRKRTFMFFVGLFVAGSLLSAIAPNIYWLIAFRAVQGAGHGGFFTSAVGIVADTFPESRQRSIGLLSSLGPVGTVFGLNVGGWFTEAFGWRSLFWFSALISIATLVAGLVLLKKDREMGKADFDVKGAGLFAASLGALMIGITSIGSDMTGQAWALVATLSAFGVALMIVFLRHEMRVENPMIDLEVLRGRPFVAANIFNTAFGMMGGVFSLLPLYAVTIYGVSAFESGLIVTPRTIGMFAGSVVSSLFLVRWGYRRPMMIGTILTVAACFLFGLETKGVNVAGIWLSGMVLTLGVVTLGGLGQGFSSPASNNACIELMPDRVSTIVGIRSVFRHGGNAVGVAIASIMLERFGSLDRGFVFVWIGAAVIGLITIPCIFAMPRSPSDVPAGSSIYAKAVGKTGGTT
jgi:EmrB/QacA subfamily drug resistance transporter